MAVNMDVTAEEDATAELELLRNISSCSGLKDFSTGFPNDAVDVVEVADIGSDWFEEAMASDDELPALSPLSDSEEEDSDDDEEDSDSEEELLCYDIGGVVDVEEFLDALGQAFVIAESAQSAGTAELYDSGCTNHISPY